MTKQVLQEKIFVESKLIEFLIYNYQTNLLEVKYKQGKHKGELRKYSNFDSSALDTILQSDSPGKTLLSTLKQIKEEEANKSVFHKIKGMLS